jgi:hypothetical protein
MGLDARAVYATSAFGRLVGSQAESLTEKLIDSNRIRSVSDGSAWGWRPT